VLRRARPATRPTMRRRAGLSYRLLDPTVRLPLLSRPHSTTLPSPKRYERRCEVGFLSREERTSENLPTKQVSDVCLYLRNRQRIFRGRVQVRVPATYFSRPNPALAFANGSMPVSSPGILAAANLFIHCPKILWLAISSKAGIDSFPTLYRIDDPFRRRE